MKNILITGITGMLGKAVLNYFNQFNEYKIFGISRQVGFEIHNVSMYYGDLSSQEFVGNIDLKSYYAIIHCSAEVNVNLCELDKESAYNSNVQATKNVVSILKAEKYVYISSDSVFDGQSGNYSENSVVNPLNYYAETKLQGEKIVEETVSNFYILRTNIYGFNKTFKNSLFEWGYTHLKSGISINGFDNMYFNPMYIGQLAKFIEVLINSPTPFGTYNIGTTEIISKYEFLMKIVSGFNFSDDLVNKVYFNQEEFVARRSLNTTLNTSKINSYISDFDFSIGTGFSMLKNDFLKS